ncbi:type 1 glutamine amidotransferase [Aquitalea aquatilis]|uniref:type 1 glutamine amidotransferase n=1 Tax=Aquitalea aquatilis TaxID=1537400 RepID=UPI0010BDF3BF|nr:type 1 glutamine amidotransferase [Aquitalea aquatilis]
MKPIAIIQHVALDGPEYFLDYLNCQSIPSRIFKVYAGDVLPADVSTYAGIATFGGPMSVNDETEHDWILPEIDFLRRAVAADVPVIGHCLGGQLLARALGAQVRKAAIPEIGWIDLQAEPGADEWFGQRASLRVFQWHSDSFDLPQGASLLASSAYCRNQAYLYDGRHLGMQFHCEVKVEMIRQWLQVGYQEIDAHDLPSVMSVAQIAASLEEGMPQSHAQADAIYRRWLQGVYG